ncbi:unnamed protein product [Effrenium voratum]|uniref:Uncharacterized protein n=1 Tax=Effrenium voratum TaxID=2562239 RepID=A0AA36I389_9DINO|nr:unnamed protein product [Effrenium voratum]
MRGGRHARWAVRRVTLLLVFCAWLQADVGWQDGDAQGPRRDHDDREWGFSRGHALEGSPEEVLQESALKAFDKELPHWLHKFSKHLAEPLTSRLPDLHVSSNSLATTRRDLMNGHGRVVLVQDEPTPHRKLRDMQHEVCHVLGFALQDSHHESSGRWEDRPLDLPLCPELWIDEGWPPTRVLPTVQGRAMPVWSVTAGHERAIMVLQDRLLQTFPDKQIKALLGYELGRMAFALLSPGMFKAWADRLSKVFLGGQVLQGVQGAMGSPQKRQSPRRSLFGLDALGHSRPSSLGTINLSLFGRNQGHQSHDAPPLHANGIVRPVMEFLALDMFLKASAPRVLRPIMWLGVFLRGGPEALLGSMRNQLETMAPGVNLPGHRRKNPLAPLFQLLAPWMKLIAQLAALQSAGALLATCGRSEVITGDRAAALAAGNAEDAAAAIMRVFGQMPLESAEGDELEALLREAADSAQRQQWALRREAMISRWTRPAPEERVRALLQWSETSRGQHLLALAEVRREAFASSRSWFYWLPAGTYSMSSEWWLHLAGHSALVAMVTLPFFSRMDLVRWASMCTLGVTVFGVLAPLLLRGAGLGVVESAVTAALLAAYSSCAWLVWWNHLLGGSRRWAELSSRLTSQLADQADVTAGIAYLTRDWAEMARRSHAALDQEFCGSWRTSLQELASKLTDIWTDIRNASTGCTAQPQIAVERSKSVHLPGAATFDLDSCFDLYEHRAPENKAFNRSDSAPLAGRASLALQLWFKVDRAVQRALHVEVERMTKARDMDDPKALQAMMNWWSADNRDVAGAAAAAASNCQSLFRQEGGEEAETLGALLLSERLQQRFQYKSFNFGDEMQSPTNDQAAGIEEFERLEQALSANFDSLQELRQRLAPMANSAGTLHCPRRQDFANAARELRKILRRLSGGVAETASRGILALQGEDFKRKGDVVLEDSPEDRAAEMRIILCLAAAALAGAAAIPYAVLHATWLWAACAFGFALANLVLLLNYQRLSLPHVHRRFERQLGQLSSRREEILLEIRDLQRSSQKAGAAHARACICLQSVNVLRNINYVLLCIKTESQRAAAASSSFGASQDVVILGGLRLLLALLPRCEKRWEADILEDEDCGTALATLANGHAPPGRLQQLVADSQKRLWILLRMVHLSSVLPIEAQGQLGSLVQRYARPILIEGRVPLQQQTLEMQKESDHQVTLQKAAGNGKGHVLALENSTRAAEGINRAPSEGKTGSVCGSSTARSSSSRRGGKDTLKKLRATRKDCLRILQRLRPEALLARCDEEASNMLRDIFSSVILLIPPSNTSRSWSFRTRASGPPRVAIALGYRHGEQVYTMDTLRTNILLRLATTKGDSEARSGSIDELRNRGPSGAGSAEEIEIPLTAILDDLPSEEDAEALWQAMAQANPGWFGGYALQERKHSLRRASVMARAMKKAQVRYNDEY